MQASVLRVRNIDHAKAQKYVSSSQNFYLIWKRQDIYDLNIAYNFLARS